MRTLQYFRPVAMLAIAAFAVGAMLVPSAATDAATRNSTADHSKFKELQRKFATGPDVTKACLACHTEAAKQVHATRHWTWEFLNPGTQQRLGKRWVLNNFCIATGTNFPDCTTCHVGYGWKDANFDFKSENNVDCLVCHDTTGSYTKFPGTGGHPLYKRTENPPGSGKFVNPVDLTKVAQKVGKTSRDTCGACHFFGGSGDGVKHGDMDSSLSVPDKELDVHMDALGLDFTCATCHATSAHMVSGSRYTPTAVDTIGRRIPGKHYDASPTTCEACHDRDPHGKEHKLPDSRAAKLNMHTKKLACQTCHVPIIARGGVPTKVYWDWSAAGQLDKNGKTFQKKDDKGHVLYDSRKGSFVLGHDLVPEYRWFNGTVKYTLVGDKIDPSGAVPINNLSGSPTDGKSKIWPVKVMHTKQPYDPVNKTLIKPHTVGKDSSAFYANFNWEKSAAAGMAAAGAPFSGKVDFVETEMVWLSTHMVAPKEKAVECSECHQKSGRLAKLAGIYVPAQNGNPYLNWLGWFAAAAALLGALIHGALRIFTRRKGD
jgi:octaheme c-type cytochrome (tetrathionate reductase family)